MENKKKAGFGSKFMNWYESYQGKRIVGVCYSLGAAIVIIGALGKIMHTSWANVMLPFGMGVEAFLFAIGCFDKPHPTFHWHEVFPQLLGHGTDPELLEELKSRPRPTLLGGGGSASTTTTTTTTTTTSGNSASADVPGLSATDMAALKTGIENMVKTASQITELSKVATASGELTEKLNAASKATDQFVAAGQVMAANSKNFGDVYASVATDMQRVAQGTQEYEAQVAAIAKQLSSLNAVYELQVKTVQAQVDNAKGSAQQLEMLNESMAKMNSVVGEALKSQEAYEAGAKKLASQVADLNKVYGNMLNALS
jgi:gliding motility-associated protein GldL